MKKRRCFLFRSLRTAVTRKVVPRFRCSLHRIYTYKTCYDQCCFSKLLVSQCLMPSLTGNKSDSTDVLNNWTCVRCTFIPVELRSKSLASTWFTLTWIKNIKHLLSWNQGQTVTVQWSQTDSSNKRGKELTSNFQEGRSNNKTASPRAKVVGGESNTQSSPLTRESSTTSQSPRAIEYESSRVNEE